MESSHFKFYNGVLIYPILLVLGIWTSFWLEIRFGLDFTTFGIKPRDVLGLRGILFGPFIHSGLTHLWHNTVPLLILSMALFYFYRYIAFRVLLWVIVLSGLGTWIFGREAYHIGISGVIYALVSFLFFKGIITKHYRLIALSLIVVFLYGSLIWGTLPLDKAVSWEGHLSGFISGFLLALCFRESVPGPIKYEWERDEFSQEEDPFMRQFDENGNFFEIDYMENSESDQEIE